MNECNKTHPKIEIELERDLPVGMGRSRAAHYSGRYVCTVD